jgi:hypothetical protein
MPLLIVFFGISAHESFSSKKSSWISWNVFKWIYSQPTLFLPISFIPHEIESTCVPASSIKQGFHLLSSLYSDMSSELPAFPDHLFLTCKLPSFHHWFIFLIIQLTCIHTCIDNISMCKYILYLLSCLLATSTIRNVSYICFSVLLWPYI